MKLRVLLTTHNTGTAFWRVRNPLFQLMDMGIIDLTWIATEDVPTRDRFWYNNFDVLVLHQEWSDGAVQLAAAFKMLGKRVIVSLDDLVAGWLIPRNITGGQFYQDKFTIQNIKVLLDMSDRIVITQPTLKKAISEHFQIEERKMRIFPNMPSFDWFGRMFNARLKADRFKGRDRAGTTRIGVLSSLSHYEIVDPRMNEDDDFQIVVDGAKILGKTKANVVWCLPLSDKNSPLVKRLTDTGAKVDVLPMAPITAYPKAAAQWDLDICAVPIRKNLFNDCKSNIKLLECAALGIVPITSKSDAYDPFIEPTYQFETAKELADKILQVRSWNKDYFQKVVQSNYVRFFDKDVDYYGTKLKGFWLDNNTQLIGEVYLSPDMPLGSDEIAPPKQLKRTTDEQA